MTTMMAKSSSSSSSSKKKKSSQQSSAQQASSSSQMDVDDANGEEGGGGKGGGDKKGGKGGRGSRDSGRYVVRPVTPEMLPFLLAIVHDMRLDSRDRVVNEFVKLFPEVSKRQVESRLPEVAVKEKRNNVRAWWLKDDYEALYLEHTEQHGNPLTGGKDGAAAAAAGGGGGGGRRRRRRRLCQRRGRRGCQAPLSG